MGNVRSQDWQCWDAMVNSNIQGYWLNLALTSNKQVSKTGPRVHVDKVTSEGSI